MFPTALATLFFLEALVLVHRCDAAHYSMDIQNTLASTGRAEQIAFVPPSHVEPGEGECEDSDSLKPYYHISLDDCVLEHGARVRGYRIAESGICLGVEQIERAIRDVRDERLAVVIGGNCFVSSL